MVSKFAQFCMTQSTIARYDYTALRAQNSSGFLPDKFYLVLHCSWAHRIMGA